MQIIYNVLFGQCWIPETWYTYIPYICLIVGIGALAFTQHTFIVVAGACILIGYGLCVLGARLAW